MSCLAAADVAGMVGWIMIQEVDLALCAGPLIAADACRCDWAGPGSRC